MNKDRKSENMMLRTCCGSTRWGFWCNHCMTRAGYECDLYLLTGKGVKFLATIRQCRNCGDEAEVIQKEDEDAG